MLLTNKICDLVFAGQVTVAFRRWQRPTVKAGGRLRTVRGEVSIVAVDVVDPSAISDADAEAAGFADADAVRHELFRERSGSGRSRVAKPNEHSLVYRIVMAPGGEDPRIALRNRTTATDDEFAMIARKLDGTDARTQSGFWTERTMDLIEAWPGRRAPELAEMEGLETAAFKSRVRRLKELGLTESLAVGYRLSPLGESYRRWSASNSHASNS